MLMSHSVGFTYPGVIRQSFNLHEHGLFRSAIEDKVSESLAPCTPAAACNS